MSIQEFKDDVVKTLEKVKGYEGEEFEVKLSNYKKALLKESGIDNEYEAKGEELNEAIKGSKELSFIYAVQMKASDCGKYIVCVYSPRRSKVYKNYKYARGIVFDYDTYEIVSQSYEKFNNVGEAKVFPKDVDKQIKDNGYGYAVNKLDGSAFNLRWYNGEIFASTKGSLSKKEKMYKGELQKNLILEGLKVVTPNIEKALKENPDKVLIFELILDGVNNVVVNYGKEKQGLTLTGLRVFEDGTNSRMYNQEEVRELSVVYGIPCEEALKVKSYDEVISLVNSEEYKGQEGVVIYVGGNIYKVKRDDYLIRHNLRMTRDFTKENTMVQMVDLVTRLVLQDAVDDYIGLLKGDVDPKVEEIIDVVTDAVDEFERGVINRVNKLKNISDEEFRNLLNEGLLPKDKVGYAYQIRKGKFSLESCPQKLVNSIVKDVVGKVRLAEKVVTH